VSTQSRVTALKEAPKLVVALDHGPVVRVHHDRNTIPGSDLLRAGEVLEELLPRAVVQLDDLLIALRASGRSQDQRVRPGGGEELGATLHEVESFPADAWLVQHGGDEPPDQT
jgi:hypothetical protein